MEKGTITFEEVEKILRNKPIDFPDYNEEELLEIFTVFAKKNTTNWALLLKFYLFWHIV